jgi:hypothetical protein
MRSVFPLVLLLTACKGADTDADTDTDTNIDDTDADTDTVDTDTDTEVPQALPTALEPYEADVLAWFNADDLPAGATEVSTWPASWGTATLASAGEDTGGAAVPERIVEGGRSAVRFGYVDDTYMPPLFGALPGDAALTEGTVAVRFRYREASTGFEYVFSIGDLLEGSPAMFSLARGLDGREAPEVFYLYDGALLFTSVVPAVGTWHTAVVAFSPSATTLHVDGVALPFDRTPTDAWSVSRNLYLGAQANGGNRGNVDLREVLVFGTALGDSARVVVEGHLAR